MEQLQTVPEIGPVVAASVRSFADEPHNRALVAKLARGRREHDEPAAARRTSRRRGRSPARRSSLTGTLATMTREEAAAAIERLGRQGLGLGQPKDDAIWSSAPMPAASSTRRGRWASRR